MNLEDLKNIYVRAYIDGKWDSYSLDELYDLGQLDQISDWFTNSLYEAIGLDPEGATEVTKEHVFTMVKALEALGVSILRL